MPPTMKHNFQRIAPPQIQRSMFVRPTGTLTAFNVGQLVPVFLDEVLPGDTVDMECDFIARLQSLITPVFANMHIDVHFFFCPWRLLYENWEKLNGASETAGQQTTEYITPVIDMAEIANTNWSNTLWDFLGLPAGIDLPSADAPIAAPFVMYNKIFNEWYRDQNLENELPVDISDGPVNPAGYTVQKRSKRKDYFTSALLYPQKGDSVVIPLGTSAPVIGDGNAMGWDQGTATRYSSIYVGNSNATLRLGDVGGPVGDSGAWNFETGAKFVGLSADPEKSHVIADLTEASSISINAFREAVVLQQMLERDARGGTRYTEIIEGEFGVRVPDYRLQRTEFLGAMSQRIDVRAVSQTSESNVTPQGNQAAYSVTHGHNRLKHSFVEHGFIMAIASVRNDVQYQQGVRKLWNRRTRQDFYRPMFAHLGEQAILRKEIYATTDEEENNTVFGYQERYAEYRYFPSMITGVMRSAVTSGTSLDKWHLADEYLGSFSLNSEFIKVNPPMDRVLAVTDEPHVLFDSWFKIEHYRPIPIFSTPGLDRI